MDSLCIVRPLANAIYGRVVLVRHRTSGQYYALKVMSLPHMRARRAVTGPFVQEDGEMELQILRKLGRNLVYMYSSGLSGDDNCQDKGTTVESWSVNPVWSNGVDDDTRTNAGSEQYLLTLHQDFVDKTTNSRCLLFDYCPRGDLFSYVAAQAGGEDQPRVLSLDMAWSYFQQISSAVRFLHARNVAHRDLSLENVLLDSVRRCRLADFGLASPSGPRCSGARVGKILYMAPEVFCRLPFRAVSNMKKQTDSCYNGLQADIWSLGVILFILVTGIPPFEKASSADARFRLVAKSGGSIRDLLRAWGQYNGLPQELIALLNWMFRVNPGERPTADQVCAHKWLVRASDTQATARISPRWTGHGEKRPSIEPEEEEDGENQEPQKLSASNRNDGSWYWSSPRHNKRAKRLG